MMIKKSILSLLLLLAYAPCVHANWFDEDDDGEQATTREDCPAPDETCPPANGGVFNMFTEDEIISLGSTVVKAPIFLDTSRPRTRDALYQLPHYRLSIATTPGLHHNFFFNRFPNFTTPLVDQLSLQLNEEFLRTLLELAQQQGAIADAEAVIRLLPLLKKIGVDEHRVGWLFQYNFFWEPFFVEIDSSLHIAERNLFASNTLTKELEETFAQIFGNWENRSFDALAEFVRVRFGLGDTRIRVGVNTIDKENLLVRMGASLIIPTVIATLRDGHFDSVGPSEQNNTLDFLINNIRRLVLNPEITNDHFALGFFFDTKFPLYTDKRKRNRKLTLHSRLNYDAFLTAHDNRLAMARKEITPEQVQRDEGNPEANIIERFKLQYLIPSVINASISPGDIFYWTVILEWVTGQFTFGLGYDYYLRQREIFEKITKSPLPTSQLRIMDATAPRISTHKATAQVQYHTHTGGKSELLLTAGGDLTFASTNVSDDWSLYLGVGIRM